MVFGAGDCSAMGKAKGSANVMPEMLVRTDGRRSSSIKRNGVEELSRGSEWCCVCTVGDNVSTSMLSPERSAEKPLLRPSGSSIGEAGRNV